jgi:hypothetical protein
MADLFNEDGASINKTLICLSKDRIERFFK